MKKVYLLVLASIFCTVTFGQVQIVNDYQPASKQFGVSPNKITSNSSFMVFAGAADAQISPFFGTTKFYEPFVSDGSGENFIELDLNSSLRNGTKVGSEPKNFFVLNDEIYFVATNDTATALYKINDMSGTAHLVTESWVPVHQPQVVMSGFPATETVMFVGKNPTDTEDNNNYFLQWNGVDSLPKLKANQNDPATGDNLYNIDGSKGFVYLGGRSDFAVFAATDPSNDTTGVELCVAYTDMIRGAKAVYTDLNPGTKMVGENKYPNDGSPEGFTVINNVVYFNSSITNEVWKVDVGTSQTAVRVDSINNAINFNTRLKLLTEWNDKLVFSAVARTADSVASEPVNVFIYDPLTEVVDPIISVEDSFEIRDINSVVTTDSMLYFAGNMRTIPFDYSKSASPLWAYNGTELKNLTPNLKNVSNLHLFNDKIYFSAADETGVDNGDGTFSSTFDELFVYNPSAVTGVTKLVKDQEFNVWPNPSSGFINVEGADLQNAQYSIFDLNGKCVEKGNMLTNRINYNIPQGVYLLHINDQKHVQTNKIIVR